MFHIHDDRFSPQLSLPHRRADWTLLEYARDVFAQRKAVLAGSLLLLNVFFQLFDGVFSHHVLTQNVPELNPLVDWMIQTWGHASGLAITKGIALFLLLFVFSMRRRQPKLAVIGLFMTAAVYGLHTLIWSGELLSIALK